MPAPSWRMYPARIRNLWLATSASAGASRSVGINSFDQRCIEMGRLAFPSDHADARRLGAETILNVRVVGLGSLAEILRITILSDLARTCVAASRLMATETATRLPLDCR